MCQAVLSPNLTKKFQWEVSQIADNRFPCVMLLGGLSVNLNHLKTHQHHKLETRPVCKLFVNQKDYLINFNFLADNVFKLRTEYS